jgi:hypothetical protein
MRKVHLATRNVHQKWKSKEQTWKKVFFFFPSYLFILGAVYSREEAESRARFGFYSAAAARFFFLYFVLIFINFFFGFSAHRVMISDIFFSFSFLR